MPQTIKTQMAAPNRAAHVFNPFLNDVMLFASDSLNGEPSANLIARLSRPLDSGIARARLAAADDAALRVAEEVVLLAAKGAGGVADVGGDARHLGPERAEGGEGGEGHAAEDGLARDEPPRGHRASQPRQWPPPSRPRRRGPALRDADLPGPRWPDSGLSARRSEPSTATAVQPASPCRGRGGIPHEPSPEPSMSTLDRKNGTTDPRRPIAWAHGRLP